MSALDAQDRETFAPMLSRAVTQMEPKLAWEVGPGHKAKRSLSLVSYGDVRLRRRAEAWVKAAPPPDDEWEFYPAKPGNKDFAGLVINIGGKDIDLSVMTCSAVADLSRERLDVQCDHPLFAGMDDKLKRQIAFIALDGLLGEDAVERWLGVIECAALPPDAMPLKDVLPKVDELASQATGDRFVLMRGQRDGKPVFVAKNMALKRIDFLHCEDLISVQIPIKTANEYGLPDRSEADALTSVEDSILQALGPDVAYLGRETHDGVRTVFAFAPHNGDHETRMRLFARERKDYRLKVEATHDPVWEATHRWG
jgi:hypothetical protein